MESFVIRDPKPAGTLSLLWAVPWISLPEGSPLAICFSVPLMHASFSSLHISLAAWKAEKLRDGKGHSEPNTGTKFKHEVLNLPPHSHGRSRGWATATSVLV